MRKVFYQLPSKIDKYEAFKEIVSSCSIFEQLEDREDFLAKVISREHIQTTGIGHGVAIAHGMVKGGGNPLIALGYSEKGIVYDDVFPEEVHLIFIIASFEDDQNAYIKAVSSILSWVHDINFREKLLGQIQSDKCQAFFTMLSEQNYHPLQKE